MSLSWVHRLERQVIKEAFKNGYLLLPIVNKCYILWGAASLEILATEFITSSIVLKADSRIRFAIQKEINLLAITMGDV